jgi:hypothetical protein
MPKATPKQGITHARVPLEAITPHPLNYRAHPREQLERIALSLIRFGQVRSIVLQEGAPDSYIAVAGHGVTEAARLIVAGEVGDLPPDKRNEYRQLSADIIPAHWTPEQVEGYLVADNLTSEGGADDPVALAQLLQGQVSAGFLLASVGASENAIDLLLASAGGLTIGDEGGVPMADDPGKAYESQFAIAVLCVDEAEQRERYAQLTGMGLRCKVLVV